MNGTPWTPTEIDMLRRLYPHHTSVGVARALGRSQSSVHQKAATLGIAKAPEFRAALTRERMRTGQQHPNIVANRFKPGQQPWNKGVKGSTGMHPNCKANHFQPGQMAGAAQNKYKPIGSLRITRDGILERKVTDDPSLYPARRWVPVARLVWEAAHGPIPRGHIVVFKPGQKTTDPELITLDRLECITRAENARRNHPRNRHPEYARLVQLKGAITRQVNRISKEAQQAQQAAQP